MSDALGESTGVPATISTEENESPAAPLSLSASSLSDTLSSREGTIQETKSPEVATQQSVIGGIPQPQSDSEEELNGPQPMPRNGPSHFHPSHRRLRHIHAISARHLSVPFTSWNAPLPHQHLLDVFFTLHQDLEQADTLPAPFYCSDTIYHTSNPCWASLSGGSESATLNLDSSVSTWQELPYRSFIIILWDRSVTPIRTVVKWRVPLHDLMFLSTTDLDLPPNTILFHLFDGIYVPRETRLALEERAVIVRDESFADPDDQTSAPSSTLTNPKPSLSRAALLDLIRRKRDTDKMRERLAAMESSIASNRDQHQQRLLEIQRQVTEKQESVDRLRGLLQSKQELLQRDADEIQRRRDALLPQAEKIKQAQVALAASVVTLEDQRQQLFAQQQRLQEANFFVRAHAARLICQLRDIYRIENRMEDGFYTINGIVLPNSVFINCDEETIAAGLGHVCHVVHLLSRYLAVPLRYPMRPMQTRSTIEDPISNIGKYPLYSKNQDPTQFEYAVFLLNKNLEQLIHSEGLEIESLRPTLPNLKLLLDSFHSDLDPRPRTASTSAAAALGVPSPPNSSASS
eukprot:TRINITY_DN12446_c0_g1_i1.p1 TRINITY_DN12446_c0_g1~~TRINITY_DN12446_c0_g1_i1.p1  ORF type:complete len:575 (+),score=76.31 TRINITY_DN12446_c0_g1_i1:31-1755(+)